MASSGDWSKARAKAIRPRGEWLSVCSRRNVGQCGRHNPHITHWSAKAVSVALGEAGVILFNGELAFAELDCARAHP